MTTTGTSAATGTSATTGTTAASTRPTGRLAGKSVVVTGGASGQGAAEAAAAAREGADVLVTDVQDAAGKDLVSALAGLPVDVDYLHLDVSSEQDWAAVAGWLRARGRAVDGLVNNAGVPQRSRLETVSTEDWNRTIGVNLTGPMLGIQTLLPLMRSGTSIVNVGSVAALTAHHTVAYTASKWGLRGLSRVAAVEYGPRGIRTNLVHPGYIDTPMMDAASPTFVRAHLALTPLGRPGLPEEVAALVVFLLSDDSAYLNGTEIPIDGGYSSHGGTKVLIDALDAAARGDS